MGALFGTFAGFYYWFPKMTGYNYPTGLAFGHFWLTFIGANLIFLPMHFLGLAGMPRRIPDYADAFAPWNAISSFGSYISLLATIFFFYLLYLSLTSKPSQKTCLQSWTLEWVLPSPPNFHTFEEVPIIKYCK